MRRTLLIAIRRISTDKINTAILIFGLSLVLYCATFVGSYINSEISFESHYTHRDRILKLFVNYQNEDQLEHFDITSHGLPQLLQDISQIDQVVQVYETDAIIQTMDNHSIRENEFYHVTDNFWKVFNLNFVEGLPFSGKQKHEIVISEKIAQKYFNSIDAVNKELIVNGKSKIVVGVYETLTSATFNRYDGLMPVSEEIESYETGVFDCTTFVLLHSKTLIKQFRTQLAKFDSDTYQTLIEQLFEDSGFKVWHNFLPIAKVREEQTDYVHSEIFIVLLGLLLTILLINTGNLSFTQALSRAKETGVRKVLGISQRHILGQQAVEAVCFSLIALILSMTMIQISKTDLENFTDGQVLIDVRALASWMSILIVFILFISIYTFSILPLFRHKGQDLIKNQLTIGGKRLVGEWILGLQFGISFLVICGSWFIYSQYDFMTSANLGFIPDGKSFISLPHNEESSKKALAFQSTINKVPGVAASTLGHRPGYVPFISTYSIDDNQNPSLVSGIAVDHNYLNFFKMKLVAGRNFNADDAKSKEGSHEKILINEAFAEKLGFENPVGQHINYDGLATIIGVVKNYHFNSLRNKIDPLLIKYIGGGPGQLMISGMNIDKSKIERAWYQFFPNQPFEIGYLDEKLNQLYREELKLSTLLGFLAMIGVLISSIGLYAISRNNQLSRTKEIGLRKILGASFIQIFKLLIQRTTLIIGITTILTIPFVVYFVSLWLDQYQNRISLNPSQFLIPITILLGFIAMSIGLHTYRSATSNPIDSLRYE